MPSIIVGRNQNTVEEINATYVKNTASMLLEEYPVVVLSITTLGTLNFTFITTNHRDNLNNFKKFSTPVINARNAVSRSKTGRNDILVDGKKVFLNSSYKAYHGTECFQHGTILYDVDLEMVGKTPYMSVQIKLNLKVLSPSS